jgi:hypothetical protein
MPALAAAHAWAYVWSSQPQIGAKICVQARGRGAQIPDPPHCPSGYWQYNRRPQSTLSVHESPATKDSADSSFAPGSCR